MSKYKLIIEYYEKGNKQEQIATLCSCSRMTVWRFFRRIKTLGIEVYALNDMSEEKFLIYYSPKGRKPGKDI